MILLELVDAEEREPVSPEVLASLRKNRRAGLEEQHPMPLHHVLESDADEVGDDDVFQSKSDLRKEKRLWRIAKIGLAVYLVLFVMVGIPIFTVKIARPHPFPRSSKSNGRPPPPPLQLLDLTTIPSVDGQAIECNSWATVDVASDQSSFLRFFVPANETIHIHSNATVAEENLTSNIVGSLHVRVSNDPAQRDAIVTVFMRSDDDTQSLANVCLMRTEIGWGVALYVSESVIERPQFELDVDLHLPQPHLDAPLHGLITSLPFFNQSFDSLDTYDTLTNFAVQGSFGSILVESVHANSILVKTSAAPITGMFNASERIVLETVLAPIFANVSLTSNVNMHRQPTSLSVETGSSDIFLNVTLHQVSHTNRGRPTYFNTIKTFGGILEAAFTHDNSMNSSSLNIKAQNNFERARIFVDSKFEGTYDVHTNLADAVVERDLEIADPTGNGRRRVFEDDHISGDRAYGWVGWGSRRPHSFGKAPGRQGHIEVVSSLSPAVLELTDKPSRNMPSNRISSPVAIQEAS